MLHFAILTLALIHKVKAITKFAKVISSPTPQHHKKKKKETKQKKMSASWFVSYNLRLHKEIRQ